MTDAVLKRANSLQLGERFYAQPTLEAGRPDMHLFPRGVIFATSRMMSTKLEPRYWRDVRTVITKRRMTIERDATSSAVHTRIVRSLELIFQNGDVRWIILPEDWVTTPVAEFLADGARIVSHPARMAEERSAESIAVAQIKQCESHIRGGGTIPFGNRVFTKLGHLHLDDELFTWTNVHKVGLYFQYTFDLVRTDDQVLYVVFDVIDASGKPQKLTIPARDVPNIRTLSLLRGRLTPST